MRAGDFEILGAKKILLDFQRRVVLALGVGPARLGAVDQTEVFQRLGDFRRILCARRGRIALRLAQHEGLEKQLLGAGVIAHHEIGAAEGFVDVGLELGLIFQLLFAVGGLLEHAAQDAVVAAHRNEQTDVFDVAGQDRGDLLPVD